MTNASIINHPIIKVSDKMIDVLPKHKRSRKDSNTQIKAFKTNLRQLEALEVYMKEHNNSFSETMRQAIDLLLGDVK